MSSQRHDEAPDSNHALVTESDGRDFFNGLLDLVAAVIHAAWNTIAKGVGDRLVVFAVISAAGTVCGAIAAPFVAPPPPAAWSWLLVSVVLHNAYFAMLMAAYRIGDLGLVYPISRGLAPLGVAALAFAIAGEQPHPLGLLGIALCSAGIVSLAHFGRQQQPRAVQLALVIAVLIAAYTTIDGAGVRASAVTDARLGYIVWLFLLQGITFCVGAVLWSPTRMVLPIRTWAWGTVGGVLAIAGYGIVLYAMSIAPMAEIAAIRETSVIFAAAFGAIFLREGFVARRIVSATVIAVGIATLYLGRPALAAL